ncbi:hypothetical protein [Caballeronia sp. LZ035]|uniref:hypothetical protein n=1 Tax=Caballeronia sp. LZ035 TaxID=3038568 RepID=UPI0028592F0F|nr:hypothetical protein [Caballeronia sp. LZ035]MDR5757041.1 hypothetical protein [Caballeronia sp. LZ035]
MTLIVAFLVSHLGTIISAACALGGVAFGLFRHSQASKVEATAAATVAAKQSQVDQANAEASAKGEQAVVNRAAADQTAAAATRDDIDAQLAAIGAMRKDQ